MPAENSKKMDDVSYPNFRLNFDEICGAVGDYSTLLPILVGVVLVSGLHLGVILLFFSLWYILTGIYYKLPVPVEPMKVMGAVVIGGGLSQKEIAASGLVIGLIFLVLGYKNIFKKLQALIPKEIIRGIQLGLAAILIKTSFRFVSADIKWTTIGFICVAGFFYLKKRRSWPDISALALLGIGVFVSCFKLGWPGLQWPDFPGIVLPGFGDFWGGTWNMVIPQFPLTVTNAILATSLLFTDLLKKEVDPDKLSRTIGWMNLTVSPFGGFPMCHGAGGLAAQYRFGARTGMSNIISGVLLIPIALFLSQPTYIHAIPQGLFGVLLLLIALEMAKHGLKTQSKGLVIFMAVLTIFSNLTAAFAVGWGILYLKRKFR